MRVDNRNRDRKGNRQFARRGTNLERHARFGDEADGTARLDKAVCTQRYAGVCNHHTDGEWNKEFSQRGVGSFRRYLGLCADVHIAARFDCAEDPLWPSQPDVDEVEPAADDRNQRLRSGVLEAVMETEPPA